MIVIFTELFKVHLTI